MRNIFPLKVNWGRFGHARTFSPKRSFEAPWFGSQFLASQDALEVMLVSEWVSQSVSDTVEPTWLMWPWWVKIPTEDFTERLW